MTESSASVASCLRVHGGLSSGELDRILEHWQPLDKRLRGFDADDVRLDLFVKERDTKSQHLTLEAHVTGLPVLIATTSIPDLDVALNEVRDDMVRLIGDAKATHRPRDTTRFRSA